MSNASFAHSDLPDAGQNAHHIIDAMLPSGSEKYLIRKLDIQAPQTVSGARDNPEAALADLLAALETLGLITDNTTAT
jgi:hypothetical protein